MASSKVTSDSDKPRQFLPSESNLNNHTNQENLANLLELLWELGLLDSELMKNYEVALTENNSALKSSLQSRKLARARTNVEGKSSNGKEKLKQEAYLLSFLESEQLQQEVQPKPGENELGNHHHQATNSVNSSAEIDLLLSSLQTLLVNSEPRKVGESSPKTVNNRELLPQFEPKSKGNRETLKPTQFESEISSKEGRERTETEPKSKSERPSYLELKPTQFESEISSKEGRERTETEPKSKSEKSNSLELEWKKKVRAKELENQQATGQEKSNTSLRDRLKTKEEEELTPAIVERGKTLSTDSAELAKLRELIINLEAKISELEAQVYEPTALINPLIPLMTELLKIRVNESREIMIETLTPVVDELIQDRGLHNLRGMSGVLAEVLPEAITHEIEKQPEAIARAIAPEIAIAIREQIRLQQGAIAKTLGPEMGRAIKAQIAHERDAMVDALYPVIGNTVAKYMTEVVQNINQKVESALSPEGISRKMRAAFQGVSEAELILRESLGFAVQAIFLIHKSSGLLINDIQPIETQKLEGDMLAGMLTAIRSFVYDCIVTSDSVSELTEIEYGNSKIVIEVAGYCYLAVVVDGAPSKEFIQKMRATLSKIVEEYDREIQEFDGDPATIPEAIAEMLKELLKADKKAEEEDKKTSHLGLLKLGLLFLFLLGIPGGYFQYRSWVAHKIETKTAIALDANPELSVYRLVPKFKQGKLILTGRVPSESLRTLAGEVASETTADIKLNNQIIAVEVPPYSEATAAEVQRLTFLLNQEKEIEIFARQEADQVIVNGNLAQISDVPKVTQALEQVPGIKSVVYVFRLGEPLLKKRIYFPSGSANLNVQEINNKLIPISQLLKQNPQVQLKIIGHADRQGTKEQNEKLALKRAKIVQEALKQQGIETTRLEIFAEPKPPPDILANQPLNLSRVVRFEPYISTQKE